MQYPLSTKTILATDLYKWKLWKQHALTEHHYNCKIVENTFISIFHTNDFFNIKEKGNTHFSNVHYIWKARRLLEFPSQIKKK